MSLKKYHWPSVQRYYDAKLSFAACQHAYGLSRTAWAKAVKRGEIIVPDSSRPFGDRRRKHDWQAVQLFYDAGNTYSKCRERFRFASLAWTKAVQRGELKTRFRCKPLEVILATSRSRLTIKRRLIAAGMLVNVCDECNLTQWRGKPLSIQIDHRNGIADDHRIENLRMLCPNCHSQTVTFAGRNRSRFV